jgi:uncharacterized protein YgbK (DUF1537 family)
MGRTTRDGIHFVHGIPIGESDFANDPLSPVRKSEVAAVLRATANLRVANMKAAARNLPGDVDCVVVDCETRAELGQIATMLRDAGCAGVLAGSAAFAEELPKILDLRGRAATTVRARPPILFVNGSLNPRALEQVRVAAELFQVVRLTPGQLLGAESIQAEIWGANDVMLCSVRDRAELRNYQLKATELGMDAHALHQKVAEAHGRLVREILDSRRFGTLVIFGGDTLMGIAQAMGWTAFVPGGEVEAGVTVATPQGMDLVVVSKAGGFGDADVLRRIHAWVHTGAR